MDLGSPDKHISAKEMECLKEAFALFDGDRDGEISTEELGKVIWYLLSSMEYGMFIINFPDMMVKARCVWSNCATDMK